MRRNDQTYAAIGLGMAFLAGLFVADGGLQSIVLGLVILGFALGRNRARKEDGRGFGRYFGEVLMFGLVVGVMAMLGAGVARTV